MTGKPPRARAGIEGALAGRPIVAGIAPFVRSLSPRASTSDLWAAIDGAVAGELGFTRLEKTHQVVLDAKARERARAFVKQARQYYGAIGLLGPVAKPLVAYYFALNLTKVYLTVTDPTTTAAPIMTHGLSQNVKPGQRYSFKREQFKLNSTGAFRLLAERTGMGFCWPNNHPLGLSDLMPYLPDGYAAYADATGEAPRLLPVDSVATLFGEKSAWLRVEVDRNVLMQRNLGPERLLKASRAFGDRFRLVDSDLPTASYESLASYTYGKKRSEVLGAVRRLYDCTLIASDRSFSGAARYLVLFTRDKLLSHEAVTFAVLHHLSNLVRYRPSDGERALSSSHGWLFTSWVDRASESYLLNLASRITGEEHILA